MLKGWDVAGVDGSPARVFSSIMKLSEQLSDEQFSLMIKLIEKFEIFRYETCAYKVINQIEIVWNYIYTHFQERKNIVIAPCIKNSDKKKVKSALAYVYPSYHKFRELAMEDDSTFINSTIDLQDSKFIDLNRVNILIVVDDFIGTGDTMSQFLYERKSIVENFQHIFAISAAILKTGHQYLSTKNIKIFADTILTKGISDNKDICDINRAKELMKEIEKKLCISKSLSLGYKQSEATISLVRTPNNTFPVFWHNSELGGFVWKAPFLR